MPCLQMLGMALTFRICVLDIASNIAPSLESTGLHDLPSVTLVLRDQRFVSDSLCGYCSVRLMTSCLDPRWYFVPLQALPLR